MRSLWIATKKQLFTPCCWETKPTHTHIHRSSEVDVMREEATVEYSCILGTEYIIYDVHVRQEEWMMWEINMQGWFQNDPQLTNPGLDASQPNLHPLWKSDQRWDRRFTSWQMIDNHILINVHPPDQNHRRPNEAACDPKIGAWRPMASLAARIGLCYHNTSKKMDVWLPLDQNTKPAI